MKENQKFEELFEQFKKESPISLQYLSDSTYFEMMDWYDSYYGFNKEGNSSQARKFAIYIWDKYIESPKENVQADKERHYIDVDAVRQDFVNEVYRILDADSTNDRANQIIDYFDSLPLVSIP